MKRHENALNDNYEMIRGMVDEVQPQFARARLPRVFVASTRSVYLSPECICKLVE
jgi:hypothetical protein